MPGDFSKAFGSSISCPFWIWTAVA
jgi:hypothetical protein